jgi:hypothetical protein
LVSNPYQPSVGGRLALQGGLVERPGQGGLAGGGIGADLGVQQGGDLAAAGDDLEALADLPGRAVVAAAKQVK